MNITLRQLQHALALARYGSFRRAAAEEHISQPAFSRSIHNLEEALGAQLFDRNGHGATITQFGETVLRHAREIIASTTALNREMDLLRGLEADSLRVAMGTFPAELSAARALGELVRRQPDVRCTANILSHRKVEREVLERAVDLGIADYGNLVRRDLLLVEPIGRHELVFFCRPDHPLVERQRPGIAQLEAYPLVWPRIPPRLKSYRPYNSIVEEEYGDQIPHIEVEQFSLLLAVVAASDTLGVAPPVLIEARVRNDELHILPFRAAWMSLEYGFITLRGHAHSPAAGLYSELVRELEVDVARRNQALVKEFLGTAPLQRSRR